MGFGKGIYSFGNDKSRLLDEYSPLWSLSNILRTADYAWNFSQDENVDPARLVAIEQLLAIRPNPRAGERIEPIDLDSAMTDSWNAFLKTAKPEAYARHAQPVNLPRGRQEIGFLPMRLSDGEHDCIVLRKDSSPVTLPVRGRFASLIFLHTAFVHDPNDKTVAGVRIREWMYGWPCGNYVVQYADGSHAVLPVRLTNNIKRFDTASATRATLDNRYTWTIDDANGDTGPFVPMGMGESQARRGNRACHRRTRRNSGCVALGICRFWTRLAVGHGCRHGARAIRMT